MSAYLIRMFERPDRVVLHASLPRSLIVVLAFAFGILICSEQTGIANDSQRSVIRNPGFEEQIERLPKHWKAWTPRAELSPEFSVDSAVHHSGTVSARIRCHRLDQLGVWKQNCPGITGKTTYRFSGYFRTDQIETIQESVWAKLEWKNAEGEAIAKDYAIHFKTVGDGWCQVQDEFVAPDSAASAEVEVGLQWCLGSIWWDDLSLQPCSTAANRVVRVSTGFLIPASPSNPEKNRNFFVEQVERAKEVGSEIVCFGETVNYVRTGLTRYESAESIPGPSTNTLGDAARRSKIWIVVGLYEREGSSVYNTAVLINRDGKIAGRYRKTHLPETEVIDGVVPGNEYPVFKTDFGIVGLQICWDNFFPEVARSLALNGAEIIFTPIWGDGRENGTNWEVVSRARAIDNSIHFVASTYNANNHTLIVDPTGRALVDSKGKEGLFTADLNLDTHKRERWLSVGSSGEWKQLLVRERRPTTYGGLATDRANPLLNEVSESLSSQKARNANDN